MRDIFQTTITQQQADGTLKAISNVQIGVYLAGTSTLATIYQRRTGSAQGPAPEANASGGPNPFTTGASGAVEFWCAAGVYDIVIQDLTVPHRIASRGGDAGVPLQWNAMPADTGSIPTAVLAADAGIRLASIGADILRQVAPIGAVLDWWRPSSAVPLPAGFEIADGRQIAAGSHDFGVAGAVNLPDLRNKFILGADSLKADGSGSVAGDGTAAPGAAHPNAPGIGGTGGANATKNLNHTHSFAHTHGVAGVDHLHSAGSYSAADHYHQVTSDTWGYAFNGSTSSGGYPWNSSGSYFQHTHHFDTGSGGASALGVGGYSGAADRSLNTSTNSQSTTTTAGDTSSAAADMRPAHFGLLKIIKVRRA